MKEQDKLVNFTTHHCTKIFQQAEVAQNKLAEFFANFKLTVPQKYPEFTDML